MTPSERTPPTDDRERRESLLIRQRIASASICRRSRQFGGHYRLVTFPCHEDGQLDFAWLEAEVAYEEASTKLNAFKDGKRRGGELR